MRPLCAGITDASSRPNPCGCRAAPGGVLCYTHARTERMARLEAENATLLSAARRYVESHKLMGMRFQDGIGRSEYAAAADALCELLAARQVTGD